MISRNANWDFSLFMPVTPYSAKHYDMNAANQLNNYFIKSFSGVQGAAFQKSPLAAGGNGGNGGNT